MDVVRRISLFATAFLLLVAGLLGWVGSRPPMSASSASELASATAYFDSTIVLARNGRPRGARGDALTVGLGYLERSRLGLGDPFRLADEALHDPRIDSQMAKRVAWAIMGRLRRGDAYVIDPAVLDGAGPWDRDGRSAPGRAHIALIERAIASASDPRAGELTVRLAYLVASGKGTVTPSAANVAAEVAALTRDRELAESDLRELLADANRAHEDAMALLVQRRASRELRVEQPALAPLTSSLRTEAMNGVPELVAELDTLHRSDTEARQRAWQPLLGASFANRLETIGEQQPTIAQVVVTLRGHPRADLSGTNEETLAASPVAAPPDDSLRRASSLAMLASAVSLRGYAQRTPWFVGDRAPDAADVVAEFGLRTVTFARGVPSAWRPYYLRELQQGLRDLQEVFPALSVSGLNIAFGTQSLPDSALAMHDPRTRTLQLTINTSAGTIAHELAHDLDWQTSRRMFAVAGGYSTDRSIREQRGALASSMRGLAEARLMRPLPAGASTNAMPERPAELFARGVDWFTSSVLAMRGRSNGFLSGVQDGALPGYAAGAPTIGAAGASALVSAIDQMTFVPDSVQAMFHSQWADPEVIDPVVAVRRVFGASIGRVYLPAPRSPLSLLPAPSASLCSVGTSPEAKVRERLIALAVDARAHGIAMRRARYRPSRQRADWTNGMLGVAPWDAASAEPVIAALRAAIVTELRSAPADQGVLPVVPASFRSSAASCSVIAR